MDGSALLRAWSEISANCVIALEDVDSVFEGRKALGKLSFSALLNSLDGVGAVEGSITAICNAKIKQSKLRLTVTLLK
jgi:mitochondrial chaperone BCS1